MTGCGSSWSRAGVGATRSVRSGERSLSPAWAGVGGAAKSRCTTGAGIVTLAAQTGGTAGTITLSSSTNFQYKNNTASYVVCAFNSSGNGDKKIYFYNSINGGSVKTSSQASIALCISTGS